MPDLISVTELIYRWQITLSLYMCQIHKNKSHNSWNNSNYACGDAYACTPRLKRLYTLDLATTSNKLLIVFSSHLQCILHRWDMHSHSFCRYELPWRYCQHLCHHLINQAPSSSTPRNIFIFCANMVTTRSRPLLSTLCYIQHILLGS